ncbi:hypothetical protein [Actinomadura flavalba]|uniref:hypothetical protein n=1 Tax=Actinomadura flavalba TaxID=1120938 RepID=UPI00036777C9|nr:hypothetical protein [Actinomadura flavalba]
MSELGRALRQDARRAALIIAVPLLAVTGCLAGWPSLVPGVGYWDNSVVALLDATRVMAPLAAGLAAWAGVRERRLDFLHDLTARSPATAALLDLLLLAVAALTAYALVALALAAETLSRQDAGAPAPLGLLPGAAALVLHVVAGYLTGRVVPRAPTPLAVAAVALPWALLRPAGTGLWSLLPPAAYDRVDLFSTLRPAVLAAQTLWSLGLTAALVLGYTAWLDRRRALVAPLALALAASAAAAVGLAGARPVQPAPAALICRDWPLTVCVHPALRAALPAVTASATPLAARLTGTPAAFTRVEQGPVRRPAGVRAGVAVVHLDDDLSPGHGERAARQIIAGLVSHYPCPSARTAQYRALVDSWLLGTAAPALDDPATARRFGAWPEETRRAWLRGHYTSYERCALGARTFRHTPHDAA